jgi:hypothetical protein
MYQGGILSPQGTGIYKEGIKEGMRTVAENLKALGEPADKIARVTGLSLDEIVKL